MKNFKSLKNYFSKNELILWISSLILIILSFLIFDHGNYLTLIASLVGATSLIFCAKGNPIGLVLMIIFSIMYAIISYSFSYYGEMITYLGMTLPMSGIALYSWFKNPYKGNYSEVKVDKLTKKDGFLLVSLSAAVTFIFYFILKYFSTPNLVPSTISITTSFIAAYLTFRRCPAFAFCYALNDVVLIVLWTLASFSEISYLSVVICFIVFFINDMYGFINWTRMQNRQQNS